MIELKGLFPVKKQTKKAATRRAAKNGCGGLLDIAKSIRPKAPANWLDLVTPQQRAEIIETCHAIVNGEIVGSIRAIAAAWKTHGIDCSRAKLTDLVAKVRRGEVK